MSILKECVRHLSAEFAALTGSKFGSGHAHELLAAYFGYDRYAVLAQEVLHPLDDLPRADILIPDLALLDRRIVQMVNLPADLPGADTLAQWISEHFRRNGHFAGQEWLTRDLEEHVFTGFLARNPSLVEHALADEIAATGSSFDELRIGEIELEHGEDALLAIVGGALGGEQDEGHASSGDANALTMVVTFRRVAGRVAYSAPTLQTVGAA